MKTTKKRIDWRLLGERRSGLERRVEQLPTPDDAQLAGERRKGERRQPRLEAIKQVRSSKEDAGWFDRLLDSFAARRAQEGLPPWGIPGTERMENAQSHQSHEQHATSETGQETTSDMCSDPAKPSAREEEKREETAANGAQQAADDGLRTHNPLQELFERATEELRATRVIDRTVPSLQNLLKEVAAQLKAHDVGDRIGQSVVGNAMRLRQMRFISPNMPPGSASLVALLHSTLRKIDPGAKPLLNWEKRPCADCPDT